MQNLNAMMGMPNIETVRPAFTVQKLQGKVPHTQHIFDTKSGRIKSKVVEEDAGYLVTFAKGHSIRVRDEEHLKRIGAGARLVPLVDTESGDVVGSAHNMISEKE